MDGLEDKIAALLSSPDAMDKVMNMAKSLTGGAESNETSADDAPPSADGIGDLLGGLGGLGALSGLLNSGGDSGGIGDLLGGIDPAMMGKIMGLMGEYNKKDDRRENLLKAVKPYLRPERQDKMGKAVQIAKLARTAQIAFRND